jgi:ketosteroid isomerase-like protein
MEGANVEIIRRGLDAYNRGDVEAVLETADPDIEFVPLRSLIVGGSYLGHEGIRRFFEDLDEEWENFSISNEAFREREDSVLLLGEFKARGKASGVEVRSPVAWLFELHGGKVVRMRAYSSQDEALRALTESE